MSARVPLLLSLLVMAPSVAYAEPDEPAYQNEVGISGGVHALGLGYGGVPYALTGHYERGTERVFLVSLAWVKAPEAFDYAGPSIDLGGGLRHRSGSFEQSLTFGATAFFGWDYDGGGAGGIGGFLCLRGSFWITKSFGLTAAATGRAMVETSVDTFQGSLNAGIISAY